MDSSSLYTHGYLSGTLEELNLYTSDFISMCHRIREKAAANPEVFIPCSTNSPEYIPGVRHANYMMKVTPDDIDTLSFFQQLKVEIFERLNLDYPVISRDWVAFMNDGCCILPHQDRNSTDGKQLDAVLIVYLSDKQQYNGSGNLMLVGKPDRKTVDPVEGNFFIFETAKHNLLHKINPVFGDFKRLTYVAQIQKGVQ